MLNKPVVTVCILTLNLSKNKVYQTWAGFHNHLIRLKFKPKYFMHNYSSFRQIYQEC